MVDFHPLAKIFPMIEGREFDELVADVSAYGLRERIVILDDLILDGRNRYRAGIAAGIINADDPPHNGIGMQQWCQLYLPEYEGDPLAWVLSKNLHRRHLTESQRAAAAAELGKLPRGRPPEWKDRDDKAADVPDSSHVDRKLPQADRAEMMSVSERMVRLGDAVKADGAPEVFEAVKNGALAMTAAAEVAKLPVSEQLEILRSVPKHLVAQVAKERQGNAGRVTMPNRVEPDDSLDYFPTPPWATRALVMDILQPRGISLDGVKIREPACGEGHISGVLEEFVGAGEIYASDIFDYSADGISPPRWVGQVDYADPTVALADVDWTITNPPFDEKALAFALRALATSTKGVAMFFRSQWAVEGIGRYNELFSVRPPSIEAYWTERVPLHKGRWMPDGDTMTAYCWLVWVAGLSPQPVFRIPPGRRVERSLPTDTERFTAMPVRALT